MCPARCPAIPPADLLFSLISSILLHGFRLGIQVLNTLYLYNCLLAVVVVDYWTCHSEQHTIESAISLFQSKIQLVNYISKTENHFYYIKVNWLSTDRDKAYFVSDSHLHSSNEAYNYLLKISVTRLLARDIRPFIEMGTITVCALEFLKITTENYY